jgi:hypothetical protein
MDVDRFIEATMHYTPRDERRAGSEHPYLAANTDARVLIVYPEASESTEGMQLAAFAVREAGHAAVSGIHTIESKPAWPNATYDRFGIDEVGTLVQDGLLVLPPRLHRPELLLPINFQNMVELGARAVSGFVVLGASVNQ